MIAVRLPSPIRPIPAPLDPKTPCLTRPNPSGPKFHPSNPSVLSSPTIHFESGLNRIKRGFSWWSWHPMVAVVRGDRRSRWKRWICVGFEVEEVARHGGAVEEVARHGGAWVLGLI
uniref:Uncharacterized protein n=1 Tax=Cannabis sativa TaxID=3483 RepID=A0A803PNZ2_CANSA